MELSIADTEAMLIGYTVQKIVVEEKMGGIMDRLAPTTKKIVRKKKAKK